MAGFSFDDVMSMASQVLGSSKAAPEPKPARALSADDIISAASRPLGSAGDVRQIISSAAKKHGVPEDLLHNIAGSESSYQANVTNKTGSTAKGLFQFVDSTWKGLGGTPGRQFDPNENADLGAKYVKQNAETLRSKLGRDPSYGEVYAAHYFGPGVASMIDRASPNMPIERGLSMFNSREQVNRIMRQNPNLRGKSVGQVMESLHQKAGYKTLGSGGRRAEAGGEIESNQVAMADPYADSWESEAYGPDDNRAQNQLA